MRYFLYHLLYTLTTLLATAVHLPAQSVPDSLFVTFQYRNVGPTRGGRVTAVCGVASQPGTFYMGATGGGVWQSTDYGVTWQNISDGYFATPSIGDIQVAQQRPDLIYVGTGTDGLRSNLISGKGMYKSTDGGRTWQHIGLEQAGQIGAVEIDPQHPDTVFVAAIGQAFQPNEMRGVFRSYDGGQSWQKVLYLSDIIGAVDIELAPDDPQTVYATMWRAERKPWTIISGGLQAGGIYKSTDGGNTWQRLINGLPQGLIGKIDLGVSPADPDRLYALVEAPAPQGGLYVSYDRGQHFEQVSADRGLVNRPFYYCNVEVNPQNANSLYVMAMRYYHSVDGGKTWKTLRPPHGDNHDMWIHPKDTNLFIEANDGGATITTNGGQTWSSLHNQPTAELYQVEVDDQYPYWLYAGQQDNTTISLPSLPPYYAPGGAAAYWMAVGGCETGPAVPKPGDPDIVYANCKGRFGVYNKKTGQEKQYYIGATNIYGHNPKNLVYRFQRVAPIFASRHQPGTVYMGSQYVHKTTDDGVTWEVISPDLTAFEADKQVISGSPITRDITGEEYYSTIYSIQESPLQEGLLWVGANDGPVHVTTDGGRTWTDVTPDPLLLPPGGRVDAVAPSPHRKGKAYIAVLRYQLGDWHPYILRTDDYGQSWQLLTNGQNGIPADYPVRVVREDPDQEGLLYAGTEYGLFVSLDDGRHWQAFQQNLPVTPVTDIKIHRDDLILSTMGRGFWILDDVGPLRQLAAGWQANRARLFTPAPAYRYRYRATPARAVPAYPASGVIISYYLPQPVTGLQLLIKDSQGKVVRQLAAVRQRQQGTPGRGPQRPRQALTNRLDATAGLHRFVWDMRYPGPWDADTARAYGNGPLALPGTYTLELQAGEETLTTKAVINADPRVLAAGVTPAMMADQLALQLQVVDMLTRAKKLAYAMEQKIKPLKEKLAKKPGKKTRARLEALTSDYYRLRTPEGNYMRPQLIDQLQYLYMMLSRADQQPGQDAYKRFEELQELLENLEKSWDGRK